MGQKGFWFFFLQRVSVLDCSTPVSSLTWCSCFWAILLIVCGHGLLIVPFPFYSASLPPCFNGRCWDWRLPCWLMPMKWAGSLLTGGWILHYGFITPCANSPSWLLLIIFLSNSWVKGLKSLWPLVSGRSGETNKQNRSLSPNVHYSSLSTGHGGSSGERDFGGWLLYRKQTAALCRHGLHPVIVVSEWQTCPGHARE